MKNSLLKMLCLLLVLGMTSALTAQKKKNKKEAEKTEEKKEKQPLDELGLSGLKFRSVGPAITSGRISDFAMHPDNPFEYYVATASGGVWKTNNWGTT
ncbi:MAG: hypothetical protein AAF806_33120, partial [Bacteroidota bacterium]